VNQIQVYASSGTFLFEALAYSILEQSKPLLGQMYTQQLVLWLSQWGKIYPTEEAPQSYYLTRQGQKVTVTKRKGQPYQKNEILWFFTCFTFQSRDSAYQQRMKPV